MNNNVHLRFWWWELVIAGYCKKCKEFTVNGWMMVPSFPDAHTTTVTTMVVVHTLVKWQNVLNIYSLFKMPIAFVSCLWDVKGRDIKWGRVWFKPSLQFRKCIVIELVVFDVHASEVILQLLFSGELFLPQMVSEMRKIIGSDDL